MEWGTISAASIAGMVFTLVISVGVPIVLCVVTVRKTKAWIPAFFIGAGIFVSFALVLEQILHTVVFMLAGQALTANIVLYGLYGGLAAAVFEETGRYVAMRFCLKKHLRKENALLYGVGHGGIEAILIVGLASVSNLVSAVMINSGSMQASMAALDEAMQKTTFDRLSALWLTPSYQFYMGGVERCLAIVLQICLSVLVYLAVSLRKKGYLAAAFGIHFGIDWLTVVVASYLPIWAVELMLAVMIVIIAAVVTKLYFAEKEDQVSEGDIHEN